MVMHRHLLLSGSQWSVPSIKHHLLWLLSDLRCCLACSWEHAKFEHCQQLAGVGVDADPAEGAEDLQDLEQAFYAARECRHPDCSSGMLLTWLCWWVASLQVLHAVQLAQTVMT